MNEGLGLSDLKVLSVGGWRVFKSCVGGIVQGLRNRIGWDGLLDPARYVQKVGVKACQTQVKRVCEGFGGCSAVKC
jgi:hypothetical protein